ncbi:Glutamine amidotransferase class-I [gamma proteobacterium HdN1]|nr:Glutamine amidotransferase class-I [gamma proteobacterium HdN1]
MRIHIFQHVAFEGAGFIAQHLEKNHSLHYCPLFSGCALPRLEDVDALVIMGGPMSVNDTEQYPWLQDEQDFVRRFAATGKPMLGICLGAQTIAKALGGSVFQGKEKEIGWWPILNSTQSEDLFQFPKEVRVFHWHGETFHLPPNALRLASSAVCENQAFQIGRRIIGLQFHLETTPESALDLIENCRHELVPSRFIQSEAELLNAPAASYQALNALMAEVLAYLLN